MKRLKKESKVSFFWISVSFLALLPYAPDLLCMPLAQPSDFQTEPIPDGTQTPDAPIKQVPEPISTQPSTPSGAGLETVQVSDEKTGSQGNWLKKKNWLLKSYEVNASIYDLTKQIINSKGIYQGKYKAIDEELDNFYKELGIEQGKIKELFENVGRYLEKKRLKDTANPNMQNEKTGAIDQDFKIKIEVLENQIKQMESELEQLRLDMGSISDVDKSLTQRLQKVDEQITSAMTQSDTAKTKVEDLWDIIDDKKARSIYYDVLNIEANLKAVLSYLKDVLASDFDKVVDVAKGKIASVKTSIKSLEDKGLIIKDRSRRIEQIKLEEMQKIGLEAAAKKKEQETKKAEVKPVAKKEQNIGLIQKVYLFVVEGIARTYNFFARLFSKSNPSAQQKAAVPVQNQGTPALSTTPTPTTSIPTTSTAVPVTPAELPTTMPNAIPTTDIPLPNMPSPAN